jgi:hypothetical protein
MANSYTKAAFTLTVTAAEAALLNAAQCAAETLSFEEPEGDERRAAFAELGAGFAAAFPAGDDDPFAGFLALFDDAAYPALDCDIHTGTPDADGRVGVYFGGDQVAPDTLAELIRRCCPSALPCGFEYALDCDRLRAGEFGGGYVVITAEGIAGHGSSRGLERARPHPRRGRRRLRPRHARSRPRSELLERRDRLRPPQGRRRLLRGRSGAGQPADRRRRTRVARHAGTARLNADHRRGAPGSLGPRPGTTPSPRGAATDRRWRASPGRRPGRGAGKSEVSRTRGSRRIRRFSP